MNRAGRLVTTAVAAALLYLASVLVSPLRRFDDLTKLFDGVHHTNRALHAHGLPSLRAGATALVLLALVALLWTIRGAAPIVQLRAVAIPLVSLAVAEAGKIALPRPARSWEPLYTANASYPSAHAATAAGCLLAWCAVSPTLRRTRVAAAGVAAVLAVVMLSGQHRVGDAVGGALVAFAAVTALMPDRAAWRFTTRPRRVVPELALAVLLAAVGATGAPGGIARVRPHHVDVAFAIAVVIVAIVADALVALSVTSAGSRNGGAPAVSARSPRTAAPG